MVHSHTIETYGPQPNNRNIWPYNSQATVFCHAWPILLSVFQVVLYTLLTTLLEIGPGLTMNYPLIHRSACEQLNGMAVLNGCFVFAWLFSSDLEIPILRSRLTMPLGGEGRKPSYLVGANQNNGGMVSRADE